ncbi:MAG: peroxide stress protein YaaA, partial [Ramlibacter sp.]|nr:peroxide stress protein YaaA [Ramlibacter sp.]
MLFLLSPAKTLDYASPLVDLPHSRPLFAGDSWQLIEVLRKKSPREIEQLMDLSEPLSALNVARYQAWSPRFTVKNSRQSVMAFDGDVYDGLQARTLSRDDLDWANDHLCILSGLYGVLRPFDRMQPYRLEMGTALQVGRARNLYQFWGPRLSQYLNTRLAADCTPVVVNLASQEYFKAVDRSVLKGRIVECVFEEYKPAGWQVVSFFAKKARGLMARFAIQRRAQMPEHLEEFAEEGYAFDAGASTR